MTDGDGGIDIKPAGGNTEEVIDGRTARRSRNREAVIDAVVQLFSENNLHPRPEEVARRSGLSTKSVQRYFENLDDLINAALEQQWGMLVAPLYHLHAIGQGALDARIDRFVAVRLKAYEVIRPTARAANVLATTNGSVQEKLDWARTQMRQQIELHFAPELEATPIERRQSKVAAIDALFQFESLDHYRLRRGFSMPQTHDMLVATLRELLDPPHQSGER